MNINQIRGYLTDCFHHQWDLTKDLSDIDSEGDFNNYVFDFFQEHFDDDSWYDDFDINDVFECISFVNDENIMLHGKAIDVEDILDIVRLKTRMVYFIGYEWYSNKCNDYEEELQDEEDDEEDEEEHNSSTSESDDEDE